MMEGGSITRVQALIANESPPPDAAAGTAQWLQRLCRAAVRTLPASWVAVSLITDAGSTGTAAASDAAGELIEELQFTLGEGPCLEAFATRRPVLECDLTGERTTRWPGYSPAAYDLGVRAVFALPLQIGAARLGVLDVYRNQPGLLPSAALAQALTFAEIATMTLLDGQEGAGSDGTLAGLDDALGSRFEVHHAQGMVMVQLGVGLGEAMTRLRAHAYAYDRRLGDVARDIVARRLRLEQDAV